MHLQDNRGPAPAIPENSDPETTPSRHGVTKNCPPTSPIAEEFCFGDASSFSRAFRREFGHSPTDVHAAAMAGLAPSAMLPIRMKTETADFSELLRGFQYSAAGHLRPAALSRDRRDPGPVPGVRSGRGV
jgi:AraC-like DNA-binding protein